MLLRRSETPTLRAGAQRTTWFRKLWITSAGGRQRQARATGGQGPGVRPLAAADRCQADGPGLRRTTRNWRPATRQGTAADAGNRRQIAGDTRPAARRWTPATSDSRQAADRRLGPVAADGGRRDATGGRRTVRRPTTGSRPTDGGPQRPGVVPERARGAGVAAGRADGGRQAANRQAADHQRLRVGVRRQTLGRRRAGLRRTGGRRG